VGSTVVLKKYDAKGRNLERKSDKTLQLSLNELYTVEGMKDRTYLVRASPDADPRWIPSFYFRRAISWTVNSVQGEKVTENYAIFETEDTSDWRHFYTAVSRAEHLNKVWIYTGVNPCPRPELKSVIKKKIDGHAVYDKNVPSCDITVQWVLDRLQENNIECKLNERCICEEAQMKLSGMRQPSEATSSCALQLKGAPGTVELHREWVCEPFGFQGRSVAEYQTHCELTKHLKRTRPQPNLRCEPCGTRCRTEAEYNTHLLTRKHLLRNVALA